MKKKLVKWMVMIFCPVLAAFLLFGMILPYINSVKQSTLDHIERAVHQIIESPDLSDMERAERYMETVLKSAKNTDMFEAKAIEAIQVYDADYAFWIYDFTEQQIMLEKLGYESAKIRAAQDTQIREAFELFSNTMELDDFLEATLKEPLDYDRIYGTELSYYVSPQTVLVDEFLPGYLTAKKDSALASGNTGEILSLCNVLALAEPFGVIEASDILSVEELLNLLKNGAEEIIVKPDSGGYYDDKENDSDSSHKNDELFDAVINDLLGLDGESASGKVKTINYFGDLASYFYTQTFHYEGTDKNGKTHTTTQDKNTRRYVFLREEIINEHQTVDEKYVQYAYADDMVAYHKDGYCFAIGKNSITCFVGEYVFLLTY